MNNCVKQKGNKMKKDYELSDSEKVIVQNLTTVVANANQAASLYLSQLSNTNWGYPEDIIGDLQFDIQKLQDGLITVIEPQSDRTKKNK